MEENFECPRCHNKDKALIGHRNGKPYCRACISFQGKKADPNFIIHKNLSLHLEYPLSEKQEEISSSVVKAISEGKNVLIHAVTGSGKTELVYHAMEMILRKGGHVGFATPRKDVVIDLRPRIQEAFKKADVIAVYGEHTSKIEGDIITLTTHQLYRYTSYFDLLILDEIDAFPYKGNAVLNEFFRQSVRGNYILLSATPSKEDLDKIKKDNGIILSLFERYHHHALPLPKYRKVYPLVKYITCLYYLERFVKEKKPVFIFTPTIEIGKRLFKFLFHFYKCGSFVSSQEEKRRLDIEKFKNGEFEYLVTTSILERGVTVKNLQVIIFDADHELYDKASLIQIAGRVGRKIDAATGDVYFLAQEENDEMIEARKEIDGYNKKSKLL